MERKRKERITKTSLIWLTGKLRRKKIIVERLLCSFKVMARA